MKTYNYNDTIEYDPLTGRLTWLVDRGKVKKGDKAGCVVKLSGRNYLKINVDGSPITGHKLAWIIVTGKEPLPDDRIRFIDGDSLNLRATNLTYGRGKLSSYLKSIECIVQKTKDGSSYEVLTSQGDVVRWRGKFDTEQEAQELKAKIMTKPFRVRIVITDNLVTVVGDETVKYAAKDKREAVAIAQVLLLEL